MTRLLTFLPLAPLAALHADETVRRPEIRREKPEQPYIPTVTAGWDRRPWERSTRLSGD